MSVTIKDIAKVAGVSYATVSKALNNSPLVKESTKKHVKQIADQLGYHANWAAKSLVSKKSNTIGVVWPTVERLALSSLATLINSELEQRSYSMLLSIHAMEPAVKLFNQIQVDAILIFNEAGYTSTKAQHPSSVPMITYGEAGIPNLPTVEVDRRSAMVKAVDYLAQLRHQKIGYIGDLSRELNQQEKYIGYTSGVIRNGITIHPDMASDSKGLNWQDGYEAAKSLLQSDYHPTAIVSGSYELTVGAIRAINEAKLSIPSDISIVSYDNIEQMETFDVPVTAVGPPVSEIARSIVDFMMSLIERNGLTESEYLLNSELRERTSCAPPRKD